LGFECAIHQGGATRSGALALATRPLRVIQGVLTHHGHPAVAGLTPTGYRSARTTSQNHVKFLQSDADAI